MTLAPASEAAWERLWSRISLHRTFWLGFLFDSNSGTVDELERRAAEQLRSRAQAVEVRHLRSPGDLDDLLTWLLDPHPAATGLVWIDGARAGADWVEAWDWFFRRLNEQRDTLVKVVPQGLVFACPEGLLTTVRLAAPDLWSIVSLFVEHEPGVAVPARAERQERPTEPDRTDFVEWALRPPAESSPVVARLLGESAAQLQAGRHGEAATRASEALAEGGSPQADAALALALAGKGDIVGALAHAQQALSAGPPLGRGIVQGLLDLLARSPDPTVALDAAERRVSLSRALADDGGEGRAALRELSVSLSNVGRIRRVQGDLGGAGEAYDEALGLARRIDERWGPTPESLRDLSVSLNHVGGIRQLQGDLGGAGEAYDEALGLRRRIDERWGPTPESLRDLSVSLDNVGRIRELRGDVGGAGEAYEESLGLRRRIDERWGPTPESLRDLSVSLDNVGRIRERLGDPGGAGAAYEESLAVYERLAARYGEPYADPGELAARRATAATLTARTSPPGPAVPDEASDPSHT